MGGLIAIASEPAIFVCEFHDLNGTAALFIGVLLRVGASSARMSEIE